MHFVSSFMQHTRVCDKICDHDAIRSSRTNFGYQSEDRDGDIMPPFIFLQSPTSSA